jgi:hypothetical protein
MNNMDPDRSIKSAGEEPDYSFEEFDNVEEDDEDDDAGDTGDGDGDGECQYLCSKYKCSKDTLKFVVQRRTKTPVAISIILQSS